jgi:hypothetical protein
VYESMSLDGVAEDVAALFTEWDDDEVDAAGAGVIDELRLVIAQAIAGVGRRLLDGLPPIRLTPIRSSISPTGFLLLDCRIDE